MGTWQASESHKVTGEGSAEDETEVVVPGKASDTTHLRSFGCEASPKPTDSARSSPKKDRSRSPKPEVWDECKGVGNWFQADRRGQQLGKES